MSKDSPTVTVYQSADNHKLLHDLYVITRSQIERLKVVAESGELSAQELKALDSAYDGLKKH